jgi:hypothetical protein
VNFKLNSYWEPIKVWGTLLTTQFISVIIRKVGYGTQLKQGEMRWT